MMYRSPVACWKLFDETVNIIQGAIGPTNMPPVPPHPDDIFNQKLKVNGK